MHTSFIEKQRELIDEYISKNPELAVNNKRGLARLVCNENPDVFGNGNDDTAVNKVRNRIRYRLGALGKKDRKKIKHKYTEEARGDFDFNIPDTMAEPQAPPYQIEGDNCLILPDLHIPYHDKSAFKAAIMYGMDMKNKLDTILLNGDFLDCYQVGFWRRDPTKARMKAEVAMGEDILKNVLRKYFPNQLIIYKFGNHEARWMSRLLEKVPELADFDEIQFDKVMKLARYGVEYVEERRKMMFGHLNILHGHEYRFSIFNPVNPARGIFLKAGVSVLIGHFHQASYHEQPNLNQKPVGSWSTGCLCDLNPDYNPKPYNKWNHGFAYVERLNKEGEFRVHNHKIYNGTVF